MKSEIASSPLPIFRNDSVNEEKSAASIPPGRLSFAVTRRGGKSDRGEFGQRHSWPVKWRVVVEVRLRATSTEEEEEEEEPGGRWEKRDVGGHTRSFPAASELCAPGKGCLAAAGGCNPGLFTRRKRHEGNSRVEERETRRRCFYGAAPRPGDNVSRGLSPGERHESSLFHEKGRVEEVIPSEWKLSKRGRGLWIRTSSGYVDIYVFPNFSIPSLHTLNLFIESVTY